MVWVLRNQRGDDQDLGYTGIRFRCRRTSNFRDRRALIKCTVTVICTVTRKRKSRLSDANCKALVANFPGEIIIKCQVQVTSPARRVRVGKSIEGRALPATHADSAVGFTVRGTTCRRSYFCSIRSEQIWCTVTVIRRNSRSRPGRAPADVLRTRARRRPVRQCNTAKSLIWRGLLAAHHFVIHRPTRRITMVTVGFQ
jgi:hypothetical protein